MATAPLAADLPIAPVEDVSHPDVWAQNRWEAPFRKLREDGGIHYFPEGRYGPYWAVSTFDPIIEVEGRPDVFSSAGDLGGITVAGDVVENMPEGEIRMPMFIAMDPPQHTGKRKVVAPQLGPSPVAAMRAQAVSRTAALLDSLPIGESFDWVDRVSIELTSQMLANLFDFPYEQRRMLAYWSDILADLESIHDEDKRHFRQGKAFEMGAAFHALWERKKHLPPSNDLTSAMINSQALGDMEEGEFLGNMILLIVGGNDTTRHSMTAYAYGLDQQPDARRVLEDRPAEVIPNAMQEIVRWQTPLAHMRRTATADYNLRGHTIRKGDRVVMWYASANRDEAMFPDANRINLERENARRHLSFGYGIHRCVGARVAELQLVVLMEEMAKRRLRPRVEQEPEFVPSCFVKGYKSLKVQLERY